ncbi:MAG TPA: molybdopterin-dependent oxidoreductase [Methanobacteriaceae archaeon]|nr:molybdopterin-dependent oxidoreductase [Methanobacteriaceae archaeon]
MDKKIILVITLTIAVTGIYLALENFQNQTVSLDAAEVREYQGEDLSSINDFRENSIKGPQYVNITNYRLEVTGLVQTPTNYTYDQVKSFQNYQKVVKLDCVEGWDVNILWKGVLISDLIKTAQPLPQANTIIFYAVDGYSTSFPLEYIKNNQIILAYKMNNVTIPPQRGFPFQLVAESKWGYKWIKWVNKIELSSDSNYQGYWESRGYSNSGNLSLNFLK